MLTVNSSSSLLSKIFWVSIVASAALPPVPSRGRPVAPPRRQQHRRRGHARSPRRGPAPAADGARRRGLEGRLRHHRAAPGGARRPRGDLPAAAGGGGPGGRQEPRWPLGPEEMDARCLGQISGCQKKIEFNM